MKTGIFLDGSVSGLGYSCGGYQEQLDKNGTYRYEEGETITFFIGKLMLGSCVAKPAISTLDLVEEATGQSDAVTHYAVTNMARMLLSIKTFTPEKVQLIGDCRRRIQFSSEPETFEAALADIWKSFGITLISVARTHNIVRRCNKGILKEFDVKIPLRDGRHLLADVYRPLQPGNYPVVMSMGAFGKSFINGFTLQEEDEDYF